MNYSNASALFLATLTEISAFAANRTIVEAIEIKAEALRRTDPATSDTLDAALSFAAGLPHATACALGRVLTTAQAARLIRTTRIAMDDEPKMWNIPTRVTAWVS